MSEPYRCPICGGPCDQDEVDIGVGVQTGPPSCPACGWNTEDDLCMRAGARIHELEKRLSAAITVIRAARLATLPGYGECWCRIVCDGEHDETCRAAKEIVAMGTDPPLERRHTVR